MLLEAIVLSACLEKSGCSQSMDAYYKSKPEIGVAVKKSERIVKNTVGEDTVRYTFPVIAAVASKEATVKLGHGFSIKLGPDQGAIMLKWTY